MMVLLFYLLVAGAAAMALEARNTPPPQRCYAQYGPNPVRVVPTITIGHAWTQTVYVSTNPATTITPRPTTTTVTTTATVTTTTTTTKPQLTDTVTTTVQGQTTTVTITAAPTTVTSTETTTTTETYRGATTVPTPVGFVPVQTSIPGSSRKKRDLMDLVERQQKPISRLPPKGQKPPPKYALAVICYRWSPGPTKTVTRTGTKTTRTATTPTATVTSTATTTTTVTTGQTPADATTTLTITTPTIVLTTTASTITTTTTQTVTSEVAASTEYAQCSSDNIAGQVNGQGFNSVTGTAGAVMVNGAATDPTDCCNQCAMNPNCAASFYYETACSLYTESVCTVPGQYSEEYTSDPGQPPDTGFFLSNGNCGVFDINALG